MVFGPHRDHGGGPGCIAACKILEVLICCMASGYRRSLIPFEVGEILCVNGVSELSFRSFLVMQCNHKHRLHPVEA